MRRIQATSSGRTSYMAATSSQASSTSIGMIRENDAFFASALDASYAGYGRRGTLALSTATSASVGVPDAFFGPGFSTTRSSVTAARAATLSCASPSRSLSTANQAAATGARMIGLMVVQEGGADVARCSASGWSGSAAGSLGCRHSEWRELLTRRRRVARAFDASTTSM